MKKQQIKPSKIKFQIVNIVISSDLKTELKLKKICSQLAHTEYNPDQFPGLVLKINEPKCSALLFASGRIVCTGTRALKRTKEAVNNIIKSLNDILPK